MSEKTGYRVELITTLYPSFHLFVQEAAYEKDAQRQATQFLERVHREIMVKLPLGLDDPSGPVQVMGYDTISGFEVKDIELDRVERAEDAGLPA